MNEQSTPIPPARTIRENIARIHSPNNVILSIPERGLPRLRTVLVLFRILLVIAGIVKFFFMIVPQSHIPLLVLDLVFGAPILTLFTLLAAWGHARDIQDRFQIEQLRAIPEGDQLLSRALALRPLTDLVFPLSIYYMASVILGCLNILIGVQYHPTSFAPVAFCLIILSYQMPWLSIMAGLMVSITANTVRAVTGARGMMPKICIEAFCRLLITMIILIGGFIIYITILSGAFMGDSALLFITVMVATPLTFISAFFGLGVIAWIGDALERLDSDLEAHWSDAPARHQADEVAAGEADPLHSR